MASIRKRTVSPQRSVGALVVILALVALTTAGVSGADQHVGLGTADSFAVLAGQGVTNTGPTVINGDLGTCPNDAVTGAPQVSGEIHAADAECRQAQADLTIAYDDAAGRAPTTTYTEATDLGGDTLTAGVYRSPESFGITGTLTLDADGDPDAVFIFQAVSTLITAVGSTVSLVDGAQACNVFWQVGSSATVEVDSTFVGTILALTSIQAKTNAEVQGRLLARNASVTLDSNVITAPQCAPDTTTTTSPTTTTVDTTTTTLADTTTTSSTTTTVPDTTLPDTTTTTVPPNTTTTPPSTTVVRTDVESTSTTTTVGAATTAVSTDGGGKIDDSVKAATAAETDQSLANTGSSVTWTAIAGVLTTALGTVVLLMNSRRRAGEDT